MMQTTHDPIITAAAIALDDDDIAWIEGRR